MANQSNVCLKNMLFDVFNFKELKTIIVVTGDQGVSIKTINYDTSSM